MAKRDVKLRLKAEADTKEIKVLDKELKKLENTINEIEKTNPKLATQLRDLSGNLRKSVNNMSKAPKVAGELTSKFKSLTSSLTYLKGAMTAFATAVITKKIIEIGRACINASSDMEELENVTRQVFGKMKGEVELWAKSMGSSMGRSVYQLQKQTTDMGNILKGLGNNFSNGQIREMSQNLATLASDMGSFLNISDERASTAISSALTGETESLKRHTHKHTHTH